MAQRVRKITPDVLKKIIVQEARKMQMEAAQEKAKHPEDVDAHETLAHHVEWLKALKIHERRLQSKLSKISEQKQRIRRKIAKASR
jgi:hypothetical protein